MLKELLLALAAAAKPVPAGWLQRAADDYACNLESEVGYVDPNLNCNFQDYEAPSDPCDEKTFYQGPQFPKDKYATIHQQLKKLELGWEGGKLQSLYAEFGEAATEADIRKAMALPADPKAPLPKNVISAEFEECAKGLRCISMIGFKHTGCTKITNVNEGTAGSIELDDGTYTLEGGSGTLKIEKFKADYNFKIATASPIGNLCGLEGTLLAFKTVAAITNAEDDKVCRISFEKTKDGIKIWSDTEKECADYCGVGASFDGEYLKASPACADGKVKKTRASFKKQFDGKFYASAADALAKLKASCGRVMKAADVQWIDNDLALTYAKLGQKADCLKVLEPYKELIAMSDADIDNVYGPGAKEKARLAKAVRANLKLCQ